jgi:predicted RNA binding protein with dsRBD fold (UPF0201 family)
LGHIAVTYRNDKPKKFFEPLAREIDDGYHIID